MKKENSTLAKKISSYSTLAGSFLAMANFANGQIVYTDIPDATGANNGASYDLDLNNDGTTDYHFSVKSNGGTKMKFRVSPLSGNAIAGTYNVGTGPDGPYYYPSVLALSDIIDNNRTWNTAQNQTLATTGYFTGPYGYWFGVTDKYMGFRMDIGGDDHYGWVRLDVSEDGRTFTVKDYAYESAADTAILAGDVGEGTIGINPVNVNEMSIFAFNKQIHVQLKENSNGLITVSNMFGQQIKLVEINADIQNINMADQAIGTYLVTVQQNEKVFTQKVVLQ